MSLLEPNWSQEKPSSEDAQKMCGLIELQPIRQIDERVGRVLEHLRATHLHCGAFLAIVEIGASNIFDWFASRNRLLENEILPLLLRREEIRALLPELNIPETMLASESRVCSITASDGFNLDNSFLLEGQIAQRLFTGGAYGASLKISGRAAMQMADEYSEAAFGRRYEEVSLFSSYAAWTPWFGNIAWDWTSVLFDKRSRKLWILVISDED